MPPTAGFPQPITAAERAATGSYLTWLSLFGQDDADKTRRLKAVSEWCRPKTK